MELARTADIIVDTRARDYLDRRGIPVTTQFANTIRPLIYARISASVTMVPGGLPGERSDPSRSWRCHVELRLRSGSLGLLRDAAGRHHRCGTAIILPASDRCAIIAAYLPN